MRDEVWFTAFALYNAAVGLWGLAALLHTDLPLTVEGPIAVYVGIMVLLWSMLPVYRWGADD